ncbi:MAG TPA: prepilin peptidase [Candidatus Paceibacterota bacterium]|nr:prepilin peptidase [Candidatus Paceibacterota bacterium]
MITPIFLTVAIAFLFGVIIGSFLNVVIYRFHSGIGVTGRSQCLSCGRTLSARELIPIVSFLFQRGRCRNCRTRLSWQYPLVEFATGAAFALAAFETGLDLLAISPLAALSFAIDAAGFTALILLCVYDVRHKIIPDRFVAIFIFAGVLKFAAFAFLPGMAESVSYASGHGLLFDLAAGPLLALPFALLWYFSDGRMMGLGDAKLMLGMGLFLGMGEGLSAVVLAFWVGAVPSILLLCLPGKRFTMKSELPFGPFLALGTILAYAFSIDMFLWTF